MELRGVADDGTSTTATAIVMPKNNLRAIAIAIGISTVSIVVVGDTADDRGDYHYGSRRLGIGDGNHYGLWRMERAASVDAGGSGRWRMPPGPDHGHGDADWIADEDEIRIR